MKTINQFIILGLILIFLSSCKEKSSTNETDEVSLRFDWFTSMTFSGEVLASEKYSKNYNLKINLEPGSESTDPVKLVISGGNEFGCLSAEKFLMAIEKGADLVAVGVINQISPTVFISKKEKDIKSPQDWLGKTVGILPGGSTEYIYRSLLSKLNIPSNKLTEVTVPFDLGTFVADKYDVRPAFIYDEPVFLETQNIEYDLIEPKDYDVSYAGRVYFTTRSFLNSNKETVQKFVNSMIQGWSDAIQNPELAIDALKRFEPNTNAERDLKSLKKAIPYFLTPEGKVLTFDDEIWSQTFSELVRLSIISEIDFEKNIDKSFVKQYYSEN